MASVFFNELHYDNVSTDVGEFIEIAGPAGTDLTGWSVVLYNGSNGTSYDTETLSGSILDQGNGFGTVVVNFPTNGIQNGAPDGLALVDNADSVVQFISYEGTFAATNGPAAGLTSIDIGVEETGSTPEGSSLQLTGEGTMSEDFTWEAPADDTPGAANNGQIFGAATANVFISEIHYDNAGGDVGEFVEITADAGTDLSDYTLTLYNGNGGSAYNTVALSGTVADEVDGKGAIAFDISGIQNGGPDGLALSDPDGNLIEFLSYEGTFTAVGGPADGVESTDIGVSEPSNTPIGDSLQLIDGAWTGPLANSKGDVNTEPMVSADAFISEIHYDNDGADTGEFVEVTGNAGASLEGFTLALYNGNGGVVYDTVNLSGTFSDEVDGKGAIAFDTAGIQNGPDAIALVDLDGNVVEFISYEGDVTATEGPATGQTSIDIGVSESGSTPVGQSLQLIDGTWTGPAAESRGLVNSGGGTGSGENKFIYEVQGSGTASELVGQTVTVEGIVTGDFQDGDADDSRNLRGFYVQDEMGDGDASTSDGIFIFEGGDFLTDVAVGDKVSITGSVTEFFGETQITATSVTALGTTGTIAPVNIDLPTPNVIPNSDGELIADLEQYEGMLVTFNEALTVDEYFNYDRFGEIRLSEGGRPFQFSQTNAPDVAGFQGFQEDLASRRIALDDGLTVQNPDPLRFPSPGFSDSNNFRGGDTVTGLTGNVRFSRGSGSSGDEIYRIMPTETVNFTSQNPRPESPEEVGGSLKVVSFNVLNYFTTLDTSGSQTANGSDPRGADNQTEFNRQTEKLVTAIRAIDADILGLVELENDFLEGSSGNAIENLVDELNTLEGAGTYDWVRPGQQFVDASDAISVGAIYKTASVKVAEGTNPAILRDDNLPDGFAGETIFNGRSTNRAPLAVTFEAIADGGEFTVVVNHFKSKGSIFGDDDDPNNLNRDQGDGQGNNNAIRLRASQAIDAWLATKPTGTSDEDILLLGDLNAYANEDPITFLEDAGYTDLAEFFSDGSTPYSFLFDGQLGTLDYGLANSTLLSQVTGATEWHVNADEADALDYNLDFGRNPDLFNGANPFRNSDHDPLIIGLDLASNGVEPIIGTPGRDTLRGTGEDDIIEGRAGNDRLFGRDGSDQLFGEEGRDVLFGGNGNDELSGGDGNDRLFGNRGNDLLIGGSGNDRLEGQNDDDELIGDAGNDRLFGGSGDDLLTGGLGNDRLTGATGNDQLFGNEGNDRLTGGSGNDLLSGGTGNDNIDGGGGEDTVILEGVQSDYRFRGSARRFTARNDVFGRDVISGVELVQFDDGIVAAADLF
ncbi:MAG: ExeM/NucH family extracellular endonuclease [Cyanobacteria bacterium J06614_10]